MFDPQKQTLLRQLKGHQRPVHTTRFAPDKMHVVSGSDDATVSEAAIFTKPLNRIATQMSALAASRSCDWPVADIPRRVSGPVLYVPAIWACACTWCRGEVL